MKKLIILLICMIMLLCGCKSGVFSGVKLPDFDRNYSMTAQISGEQPCTVRLTRSGTNSWTAAFTEPYALCGVTMVYDGGEVTASFDGTSCAGYRDGWSKTQLYQLISAMESAANSEKPLTSTPTTDGVIASGTCGSGGFTLSLDKEGVLCGIRLDGTGTTAKISEMTFEQAQ